MSNIFNSIIQTSKGRFALFLGIAAIIVGGVALYASFDGRYVPNGEVEVETPSVEAKIPQITLQEITDIVNMLKRDPPILTPEQRVAYLPLLYDIMRIEHGATSELPNGDQIEWQAVDGIRIIWSDFAINDQLLEKSLKEHFAPDTYNFGPNLGWYFADEIRWRWKQRPARHDQILTRVILESIIKPLILRNKDLNLQSELILNVNKNLNETFQESYKLFIDVLMDYDPAPFNNDLPKLTHEDREYLFDSLTDMIEQVPYLKQRVGTLGDYLNDPYSLGKLKDPKDRMSDLVFLIVTSVFDLNPVTNFNNLTIQQRTEIKNKISQVYNLTGLDEIIWNKFTILINPYYNGEQQFYYNFFNALPNPPLMLEDSRLVYRFGGWFNRADPDNPAGLADGSFPLPKGGIELGIHGGLHNISRYQERNEFLGNKRIGTTRLNEIAAPLKKNVDDCRNKHLPALVFGFGGEGSWWCDAPYELWATLANVYMVNSEKTFNKALNGPNNLLDQFLYVFDIFSLETNTGRFYKSSGGWFERTNRTFDFIEVPLTRNVNGQINSLTIHGKKYNFTWSNDGKYVLSYTIENVPIPTSTLSAFPNPCSIPQNQTTCSLNISWQTTNAPNACVFVKETKQLFACAASGNQTAAGIAEQGSTFEVHLSNDINSQLLASVFVKGQKQTTTQYNLNVSKSGLGTGTITAQGINCGSDCSEIYNQGALVTLTATPDNDNSTFSNWSGDCSGTSPTCNLTMNSNKTVTAVFDIKVIPPTSVCSTGSVQACIDSIIPSPVKQGQTLTFTGSGKASDPSKTIAKYRWRLDSGAGRTRLCKAEESVVCQVDTTAISPGVHTVYFRVGASRFGKTFTRWSNWIGREFLVK